MKQEILTIAIALSFNAFDMLSGIVAAVKNKDIDSSKLRDGLFKKVGFLFCYVLAYVLDAYGGVIGLNLGVDVLPIIILYCVMTEISSIVENICKINPDFMPEVIKEMLHINNEDKKDE